MPEQVAVAFRPPKSVAAVPDIKEVMPIAAMTMSTAAKPTTKGRENKKTAIKIAMTATQPHNSPAGGPRRELNSLSEINPAANPPTIPNRQSSKPQCSAKNSAPGCFTCLAKVRYHCTMPLRKTPDVNSTHAIISINGLVRAFLSSSIAVKFTCMWPDEASCVSKYGKPASSGVSLISHQSSTAQNSMMTAGMKNKAHVASTDLLCSAKIF